MSKYIVISIIVLFAIFIMVSTAQPRHHDAIF